MGSESTSRALVRLGIGLVQGAVLALLYLADGHHVFPATVPILFAPLVAVAVFIPFLVSQALGNVRRSTLIVWSLAATAIVAVLCAYDVWHAWQPVSGPALSLRIFLIAAIFLFVAHALVSCGDADRRIVAHYATLFDLAWKLGVQIAIIVCFLAAFWLMLWLGISLFDIIGFSGFGLFIARAEVAIPLTTIAAAAALHATDTSAPLVRGVRGLALTLLSWLLPVIAAIAFAFLVSLAVTGLTPLWATRTAAFFLIAAVAVLVIHINAAYQGGETNAPHILRVAGTLASVLLVFLVWIAAYALWLRVTQYGWTADRVTSAACVAVAAMFALGYLIAAILPGPWLKFIERWNVYGTFFFLIVLFALATPIADPMRLSVADQVQRLKAGVVKPDKFDFWYLRLSGGRFGHAALEQLAMSPDAAIRAKAANVLRHTDRITAAIVTMGSDKPADLAKQIRVYPAGAKLPATFLQQAGDFGLNASPCLGGVPADAKCDAVLKSQDSGDMIILIYSRGRDDRFRNVSLYRLDGGKWREGGILSGVICPKEYDALLAGRFDEVAPVQRDLTIDGHRFTVVPPLDGDEAACP